VYLILITPINKTSFSRDRIMIVNNYQYLRYPINTLISRACKNRALNWFRRTT